MTDIQAKYQKLAAEYAKLRAQLPVLKKAVIDEQAKADEFKDNLKERDQSVRKYEQEVDSLTFRNQQLSARVELLQVELTDSKSTKKNKRQGGAHGSDNGPDNYLASGIGSSVIGEELQNKIEENARLHKQVYESDQEHKEIVMQLQERLARLETSASQHQQVLDTTLDQSKTQIHKLQEEKASIEVKLQKYETDTREAKHRASSAESELKTVQEDLSTQLNDATRVIREKLPFNDSANSEWNALNIPVHDRKHQLQTKELVGQCVTLVKELVQGLSNFYTYCEQRSRVYPVDGDKEPLSDVNKKCCQYLHENATHLRPIEQSFKSFYESLKEDSFTTLETAEGLQGFASKFKHFVVYADKLLPYQLLSLEEECNVSSCTNTLQAKNMELHGSLKKLFASLTKLETYVTLLAAQSTPDCHHPRASHSQLFKQTAQAITSFHENIREVSKHFNAKVSLEHQLPTATQKLKVTDECIVSALVSLVTCSSKLSAFFAGNLEFFCQPVGARTRGGSQAGDEGPGIRCHPSVNTFKQQASDYMSLISRPCPESVPYKAALHNRKTLFSSTESRDSLAQQVVALQEKVNKLEQDKEHWMLESQLVQVKLDKEKQKVAELENQLKLVQVRMTGSIEDNVNTGQSVSGGRPVTLDRQHSFNPGCVLDTSILGQVETSGAAAAESEVDSREQLIKQHYTQRLAEMNSKLQLADSKSLHFSAECRALHKRLDLSEKDRDRTHENLGTATQSIAQLKDELQTTTRSYEGQLSMMSEHLAGMNEKLTQQKDEIDILKYQLQNAKPAKKKGR